MLGSTPGHLLVQRTLVTRGPGNSGAVFEALREPSNALADLPLVTGDHAQTDNDKSNNHHPNDHIGRGVLPLASAIAGAALSYLHHAPIVPELVAESGRHVVGEVLGLLVAVCHTQRIVHLHVHDDGGVVRDLGGARGAVGDITNIQLGLVEGVNHELTIIIVSDSDNGVQFQGEITLKQLSELVMELLNGHELDHVQ